VRWHHGLPRMTCLVLDRDGAERVPGAVVEVLDD
jgi:hypothetical protein